MTNRFLTFRVVAVVLSVASTVSVVAQKRGATPEDYFSLELLSDPHFSTDGEGNGEAHLAELGYERASRLFARALQIGRRGVSGFLT